MEDVTRNEHVYPTDAVKAAEQESTTASSSTSPANTAEQQAAKPTAPKDGTKEVINNIVGHGLLVVGFSVGAPMFAVTIPLGLLGAGVGFAIGKGVEKLVKDAPKDAGMTGAKIGGSIGSLLTGAAIMTGLRMLDKTVPLEAPNSILSKDAKEAAKNNSEIMPHREFGDLNIEAKASTPEHQVKIDTIKLMEDYTSRDAGKIESAKNKIKRLSQENRKTLLDLFNGKFITESKLTDLERELSARPRESSMLSHFSHSIQNSMGSRVSSLDVLEQLQAALNTSTIATISASYETDGKGILDIAYANASIGSLYVVDGTGHNNPTMAKALKNVFDPFTANYERAIHEKTFASVEECQTFVIDQLKELRTTLKNSQDPVYPEGSAILAGGTIPNNLGWDQFAPIGSLAQIVNIDGRQHVVHVKNGDMMLVIKKNNGDIVFGDVKLGRNSTLGSGPLRAEIIEVEPGDQIMLMTDGIGEYLPKETLAAHLKDNKNPHLLKDELKNAVINYGLNNSKNEGNANALAANGSDLHYHNPKDEKNYDDIGLSWLKVA